MYGQFSGMTCAFGQFTCVDIYSGSNCNWVFGEFLDFSYSLEQKLIDFSGIKVLV